MKLSKFLRKHSRALLMVFMSLLLVAFLIPNTVQALGGRGREGSMKLGEAFGHSITTDDVRRASADLQVVSHAGLLPQLPEDALLDYYLLMEEARRMGVRVGADEVRAGLTERIRNSRPDVNPDEVLRQIQRFTHRSYEQIYEVIGRWLAVDRLVVLQGSAITDSLPRLELDYRDRTQEAVTRVSVIADEAFLHLVAEPTEEELQAFFDQCKDRKTAHTETELVYGYRLPDRVQIEYLTVDPQKVKDRITIQAVQVKRHFEENAHRYTKPDPLASQPAEGEVPQVPMTFEEARDRVREDYREARAVEITQSLVNDMHGEARRPWGASPRREDGFAEPPAGGVVSLEELRQKFSATYEVEYGQTGLVSAEELKRMSGFAAANLIAGRQLVRMPELALRVKGILEKDPNDGKPTFNVLEPGPVVLTGPLDPATGRFAPYQAYLFRVIQVAPSGPPESLDLVRDRLVRDWKLVQAHELARQQAEALATHARGVGLTAAVEQAAELTGILTTAEQAATQPADGSPPRLVPQYLQNLQPFTPPGLTRQSTFVQRLGRVTNVPRAIFDLASAPTDDAAPHRIASLPMASQHKWVVAELVEIKPIYAGAFQGQLPEASLRSIRDDWQRFYLEWRNPDNVKQRTGFTYQHGRQPTPR
jgi:hypothetical protein